MPVVSVTQDAEAGESLEPRRWRLQSVEIVSLHSSLGDRVRLHLKIIIIIKIIVIELRPGVVTHTCNPSVLES